MIIHDKNEVQNYIFRIFMLYFVLGPFGGVVWFLITLDNFFEKILFGTILGLVLLVFVCFIDIVVRLIYLYKFKNITLSNNVKASFCFVDRNLYFYNIMEIVELYSSFDKFIKIGRNDLIIFSTKRNIFSNGEIISISKSDNIITIESRPAFKWQLIDFSSNTKNVFNIYKLLQDNLEKKAGAGPKAPVKAGIA